MTLIDQDSRNGTPQDRRQSPRNGEATYAVVGSAVPRLNEYELQGTWTRAAEPLTRVLLFSGAGAVIQFAKNSWINPTGPATANLNNNGPHGLSEILYAYSSGTGNNGSALAGLSANTPWYNLTIGLAMLIGRFLMIIPLLAVAGSLAQKRIVPASAGTLPTHGALFVGLLVGVVVIVSALTFFPALTLGPVVEHFLMMRHQLFALLLIPVWS